MHGSGYVLRAIPMSGLIKLNKSTYNIISPILKS